MTAGSIKQAIQQLHAAKRNLSAEVAATFPIGSDVSWNKGATKQHGTVLSHGGIGRTGHLRVENCRTCNQYWIRMYDVLGYVETE